MYTRNETRPIKVKDLQIGGNDKIIIQSMCNTKTKDINSTIKQINELEQAGCELVRVAVLDMEDAKAIKKIKESINIPLVADIHFDYHLALEAIKNGIDKIRINPGNIGSKDKVEAVVKACQEKHIPIRIGVNLGSLEKDILSQYKYPCAKAMIASAKKHIKILEDLNFYDICLSLKASEIDICMEAYELAAKEFNYPLHLGITEAGNEFSGTIKSCAGLSPLIKQGIGSTIRISLSDDPVKEIRVCKELLKNYHLANLIPTLISCPTCGRLQYDMFKIIKEIDLYLKDKKSNIKVAIMGCVVNGPGEAKQADIGIAGGKNQAIFFRKGEIITTIKEDEIITYLKKEIDLYMKKENN
ncbi:MAG: flavodoxin-dependent (E)-4-hydroxy-3-methylbut-2-enyl-diphosphate synthase [Bacilli bacterium]|jgi:(E)-4-hydroxy-3-methylbut-2-enyl-diphosphate synthase|nr:flavodoxin-dependent (E)-4-hydroxy-3-methylbut-2-enyl-diphosphate synthase [Bacilli bacterium]